MSFVTFEKSDKEIQLSEEKIWKNLKKAGLISADGTLNFDAIKALNARESDDVKIVIGTDERTPVAKVTEAPYNSIVLVLMRYDDLYYRGTGFFISDNIVLTAAHNIYDRKSGKPADEVYVITGTGSRRDAYYCVKLKISMEYMSEYPDGKNHDWGLIRFPEASGMIDKLAIMKAELALPTELDDAIVAGYPGAAQGGKTIEMWEASGKIDEVRLAEGELKYAIDTSKGNSGSPVMINNAGQRVAIGIHVSGNITEQINTAKTIDDNVIAAINAF